MRLGRLVRVDAQPEVRLHIWATLRLVATAVGARFRHVICNAVKAVWLAASKVESESAKVAAFSLSMESTTAGERRLSGARVFLS
jgi:hypothetical protein